MGSSQSYVLVLGQESDDLRSLRSVLAELRCSVTIASSEDQAVSHANQATPCLVILTGNYHQWSPALAEKLRYGSRTTWMTIVALTEVHAPSWLHADEYPGFDGFLVKPITHDILTSLIQSAKARQTCHILQSAMS